MSMEFMTMEEIFLVTYGGFILTAFLIGALCIWKAAKDHKKNRRCENCIHCKPLPNGLDEYAATFGKKSRNCAAFRGDDYDFRMSGGPSVSIVAPDSYCDEFVWRNE